MKIALRFPMTMRMLLLLHGVELLPLLESAALMPLLQATATMPLMQGAASMPLLQGVAPMPLLQGVARLPLLQGVARLPLLQGLQTRLHFKVLGPRANSYCVFPKKVALEHTQVQFLKKVARQRPTLKLYVCTMQPSHVDKTNAKMY